MVKNRAEKERIECRKRLDLRNWLTKNHSRPVGAWVVYFKKHHPSYLPYDAIVEECLCFGWVDSLPRKLDADRAMLYIAPRKPGSNWSNANKARVAKLVRSGLMTEAGLQKVRAAKKDGSWSKLAGAQAGILPEDLRKAFAGHKSAKANFDAFPPSSKRIILEWIGNAKTDATRKKRIAETVRKAARNIRANHFRQ